MFEGREVTEDEKEDPEVLGKRLREDSRDLSFTDDRRDEEDTEGGCTGSPGAGILDSSFS